LGVPEASKLRRPSGHDRVCRNRFFRWSLEKCAKLANQRGDLPEDLVAREDLVLGDWYDSFELVEPLRRQ
jgi:hypothetical protein